MIDWLTLIFASIALVMSLVSIWYWREAARVSKEATRLDAEAQKTADDVFFAMRTTREPTREGNARKVAVTHVRDKP
jgi:hypothetical protein